MSPVRRHTALVFDTSLAACCVGVFSAPEGRGAASAEIMIRGHSESLLPMIEKVLGEAGLDYDDLDTITAICGPGAFTGLRIGLAAAKSLALSLDIPATCLNGFSAARLSAGHDYDPGRAVALDTKRGDYYVQAGDTAPAVLDEAEVLALPGSAGEPLLGDCVVEEHGGAVRLRPRRPEEMKYGHGLTDCGAIARRIAEADPVVMGLLTAAAPLYLRPPEISRPKREQRQIADSK